MNKQRVGMSYREFTYNELINEILKLVAINASNEFIVKNLKQENDKLKEQLKEAEKSGFAKAIKYLRKEARLSEWSHSRNLKFSQIELSDYLLHEYRRKYKTNE